MNSQAKVIIGMLVAVGVLAAFWMLALAPKRQEADRLGAQVSQLKSSIAQAQQEAAAAQEARKNFPAEYQQMVLLGKAVPASDDTSTLLVDLNGISAKAGVDFRDVELNSQGAASAGTAPAPAAAAPAPAASGSGSTGAGSTGAVPASATTAPTEAAASLLPLGATVGSAGLGVMPYKLSFSGNFFHIANLMKGLDSLVKTQSSRVAVKGPLMTIDGFSLSGGDNGFATLNASFAVTTYLVPPQQGVTAGASPTAPAPASASDASAATASTVSTTP